MLTQIEKRALSTLTSSLGKDFTVAPGEHHGIDVISPDGLEQKAQVNANSVSVYNAFGIREEISL
tara:strand:+ start:304 stop:498 length:195 start_codon:yes stop_codon:yes gene_type:complete